MICPQCGANTKVYDSRKRKNGLIVWRRRECMKCGYKFSTEEHPAKEEEKKKKKKNKKLSQQRCKTCRYNNECTEEEKLASMKENFYCFIEIKKTPAKN